MLSRHGDLAKANLLSDLQMISYRVNQRALTKTIIGLIYKGNINIFESPFSMCHYGLLREAKERRIISARPHAYDVICVSATKKSIMHTTFLKKERLTY